MLSNVWTPEVREALLYDKKNNNNNNEPQLPHKKSHHERPSLNWTEPSSYSIPQPTIDKILQSAFPTSAPTKDRLELISEFQMETSSPDSTETYYNPTFYPVYGIPSEQLYMLCFLHEYAASHFASWDARCYAQFLDVDDFFNSLRRMAEHPVSEWGHSLQHGLQMYCDGLYLAYAWYDERVDVLHELTAAVQRQMHDHFRQSVNYDHKEAVRTWERWEVHPMDDD